jgi:ABC-type sugar transport system substrate-binding protein
LSFNQTQGGAVGKCIEGFVGQNFVDAGQILGTRLVSEAKLGAGDLVFAPVEQPTFKYAIDRLAGVQLALDTVGAKAEGIATLGEDSNALSLMTTWLLAHKSTVKAVATLGGTPSRNIVKAMADSGVTVPVVSFDLSPRVISDIESGKIIAAADQQGYVQGFQTIAQLAMELDFGLSPATINSGGNALIDKTNVQFAADLAGKVR